MKQVNSSVSGSQWNTEQQAPYYNYKVRILTFINIYCLTNYKHFFIYNYILAMNNFCFKYNIEKKYNIDFSFRCFSLPSNMSH